MRSVHAALAAPGVGKSAELGCLAEFPLLALYADLIEEAPNESEERRLRFLRTVEQRYTAPAEKEHYCHA